MTQTYTARVRKDGRVQIPAAIRRALGLEPGTSVMMTAEDDQLLLVPQEAIKRRLHTLMAGVEGSMAGELIQERHAEAEREQQE
jgi:AbrB family looped-hinge helix DNA binding protein